MTFSPLRFSHEWNHSRHSQSRVYQTWIYRLASYTEHPWTAFYIFNFSPVLRPSCALLFTYVDHVSTMHVLTCDLILHAMASLWLVSSGGFLVRFLRALMPRPLLTSLVPRDWTWTAANVCATAGRLSTMLQEHASAFAGIRCCCGVMEGPGFADLWSLNDTENGLNLMAHGPRCFHTK